MKTNAIVWTWRDAWFGMAISIVAAVIITIGNVETGLTLLIGALPAAVIGLLPTRKERQSLVIIGVLFGVSLMIGSLIAQSVWTAVPGMFLLAFGATLLAARKSFGQVALALCVPLAGVGLSYAGLENSFQLALLIIGGSIIAYVWSLCFKAYPTPAKAVSQPMSVSQARNYGIRLGLAAATATGIGFISGVEHVGWITGATLFVMRPSHDMQELRSIGRILSVFIGALTASWLLDLDLSSFAVAVATTSILIVASATHASRWYVTPAFTTFLVFWVLLYSEATKANIEHRFTERVLETLLGVAIAYLFGLALPKLMGRGHIL